MTLSTHTKKHLWLQTLLALLLSISLLTGCAAPAAPARLKLPLRRKPLPQPMNSMMRTP